MRITPTPGSVAGRRVDKAGDPLEGLVNLFDLSLVLAVGLLLAALSSIGATGLIVGQGGGGSVVQAPPTSGETSTGQGTEVGKVYRLADGRYVFAPAAGSSTGATGATTTPGATSSTPGTTGATGGTTTGVGATSATTGTGSTLPPASGATQPATGRTN